MREDLIKRLLEFLQGELEAYKRDSKHLDYKVIEGIYNSLKSFDDISEKQQERIKELAEYERMHNDLCK